MCELYGFCGNKPVNLNIYTNEFWKHSHIHKDGFGYYLADKNELYTNADPAFIHRAQLERKVFTSKSAMFHIRFKTHGITKLENCHPFVVYDSRGTKWTLVHNGFVDNNTRMDELANDQIGETDSERILLYIVDTINNLYDYLDRNNITEDYQFLLFAQIEQALQEVSLLGKINLIFTDNTRYFVYSNWANTLHYLVTQNGIHFATKPLTKSSDWQPVQPNTLLTYKDGKEIFV